MKPLPFIWVQIVTFYNNVGDKYCYITVIAGEMYVQLNLIDVYIYGMFLP